MNFDFGIRLDAFQLVKSIALGWEDIERSKA